MVVARTLLAIVAGFKRDPCEAAADVTLVLSALKETRNGINRIAIAVFSDPLSWYHMDCYLLEFIDGNRFNLIRFNVRPDDLKSGCKKG